MFSVWGKEVNEKQRKMNQKSSKFQKKEVVR